LVKLLQLHESSRVIDVEIRRWRHWRHHASKRRHILGEGHVVWCTDTVHHNASVVEMVGVVEIVGVAIGAALRRSRIMGSAWGQISLEVGVEQSTLIGHLRVHGSGRFRQAEKCWRSVRETSDLAVVEAGIGAWIAIILSIRRNWRDHWRDSHRNSQVVRRE